MSKESHSFSVSIAAEIGVLGAVLFQHFLFLNRENAKNLRCSSLREAPVRRSIEALVSTYRYLTPKQVRNEVEKLEKLGLLRANKMDGYDRTKSYFVTEDGLFLDANGHLPKRAIPFAQTGNSICPNGQFHLPKRAIPFAQTGNRYKVGCNGYTYSCSLLERTEANEFSNPKISEAKAPPVPPAPPADEQVSDLVHAIETAMRFTQEQPAQMKYWFECARITGWTPERLKQEVATFFSYYFRTLESPNHVCRRNPRKFFTDGFLGWLMRCSKEAATKSHMGQSDKKRAVNSASLSTAGQPSKMPF